MTPLREDILFRQLHPSTSRDLAAINELVNIINTAFLAEADLMVEGHLRTNFDDIVAIVRTGEIHVATLASQFVGCVRIRRIDETIACFGMLSVSTEHRNLKLGSQLVDYSEAVAKAMGYRKMRLELLMPRYQAHMSKDGLKTWYTRIGYRLVRKNTIEEFLPQLVGIVVVPADFEIFEKDLQGSA